MDRHLMTEGTRRKPRHFSGSGQAGFSQASALALAQRLCYSVDMDVECNSKTYNLHYQRDEHRVHLVVYHFVWCPKRRKAVLTGAIAQECQTLIAQVCVEQGWTLLELAIQPDHIHLFVQVFPSTSAADVIKLVKGRTSRELRQKYAVLRKLPSLWTRSYFVSTAGRVSQETIQHYIAAQKGM
jgi:putative transposase